MLVGQGLRMSVPRSAAPGHVEGHALGPIYLKNPALVFRRDRAVQIRVLFEGRPVGLI